MSIERKVTEKESKRPEVVTRGWLKDTFKESHRLSKNMVILESSIKTVDFWGNVKHEIPVQISSSFLKELSCSFKKGEFVEIKGEIRTKNVYDDEGNKIQRRCYIFIKSIEKADEEVEYPENHVCISGLLARKGKIHNCKNGDTMFDFTLDIRRSHGRRSSIPCVIWGKERAQYLASTPKDSNVEVEGWIKTRVITDSFGITKSVAEIIVDNFKVL